MTTLRQWDEKYYRYLDGLRESGVTNMFGARPYLQEEFGLDVKTAASILTDWMNTFAQRHATQDRP